MDNPCNICLHRHTPMQQEELGHCYMWRVEPRPCSHAHFKLDQFALAQDLMQQMLEKASPSKPSEGHKP